MSDTQGGIPKVHVALLLDRWPLAKVIKRKNKPSAFQICDTPRGALKSSCCSAPRSVRSRKFKTREFRGGGCNISPATAQKYQNSPKPAP